MEGARTSLNPWRSVFLILTSIHIGQWFPTFFNFRGEYGQFLINGFFSSAFYKSHCYNTFYYSACKAPYLIQYIHNQTHSIHFVFWIISVLNMFFVNILRNGRIYIEITYITYIAYIDIIFESLLKVTFMWYFQNYLWLVLPSLHMFFTVFSLTC